MTVHRHYPAIPEAEALLRRERLQRELKALGLKGAILLNRADVTWTTGFRPSLIAPNMAFVAVYVPEQGEVQLVSMPGLANLMRETAWGAVETVESPGDGISVLLRLAGRSGRIGVERSLGLHRAADGNEISAIENGLGAARLVDMSEALWRCRMVKTTWEASQLRHLGEIAAIGFRVGLATVESGVSEEEIGRTMWGAMIAAGADAGPDGGQLMIRSGRERYPVFCGAPTSRRLAFGDQVMLAGGPAFRGYHLDIHRFANVGPASVLQQGLHGQSRAGIDAAIAATRPGATTGEIFAAASQAMRVKSVTDVVPWRVFGHGIGLENYEYPMIEANGEVELVEGMALAIEVPAYDVPEFQVLGAFLEECVLVTATGCEVLTAGVSRDLHIAK